MDPAAEITQLRRDEAQVQAAQEELERLIRPLVPHFACNFVHGVIPDGWWMPIPAPGEPLYLYRGFPPPAHKGQVAMSLNTLRALVNRYDRVSGSADVHGGR